MNLRIALIFLCIVLPILCHSIDRHIFGNYSHEYYPTGNIYTYDRINYGNSTVIYKGILAEQTKFNLTRISKDKWNDRKDNYSVASLASGLFGYFVNTTFPDTTSENIKRIVMLLPAYLTNSLIYYPLIHSGSSESKTLSIAPFIKNDTDVFMFRSAIWGQFTPGTGVRVYYGNNRSEMGIAVGIERTLQTDFVIKTKTQDLYFVRIGFNLSYNK